MASVTSFVIYASRIIYAGSIKSHVGFLPSKQKADPTFLQVDILIGFMQ